MSLRRLATVSIAAGCMMAATSAVPARRPRYGGTLRLEIGARVNSLDPAVAAANSEEAVAKEELDALIYDRRGAGAVFAGAGPFRIAEWEPGKHAMLAANDDYHGGRPFLDGVEIQMGRGARDRVLDLELNKADFAEIPPEQARLAAQRGVRVSASQPDELMAMLFLPGDGAAEKDARVREAISRAIDRSSIVNFILQKQAEPAGGLLPQWSSGTGFLFPTAPSASGVKELGLQMGDSARIVLGYDSGDPLERAVAERVVVNIREAGIPSVAQALPAGAPPSSGTANCNARLIRWKMPSSHPRDALANFLAAYSPEALLAGVDPAPLADSMEEIYKRERAVVSDYRIVPIVWLPQVHGLGARVRDWKAPEPGESWPLADVWLEGDGS